jgi:hypothetical protein
MDAKTFLELQHIRAALQKIAAQQGDTNKLLARIAAALDGRAN